MARAKDAVPLMEEPTVAKIAKSKGKTPAQVLLRWATQRGVAVIPKSSSEGRMKENLESTGFELEQADLDAITALDKGLRFNQPTNVSFPFRIATNSFRTNMWSCSTSRPRNFGFLVRGEL